MSTISSADQASFERDGFVVKRGFFTTAEMAALLHAFSVDEAIHKRAYGVDDGQGGATEIALWNQPGEDCFGAVARGGGSLRPVPWTARRSVPGLTAPLWYGGRIHKM